jgi:hypothetical protein
MGRHDGGFPTRVAPVRDLWDNCSWRGALHLWRHRNLCDTRAARDCIPTIFRHKHREEFDMSPPPPRDIVAERRRAARRAVVRTQAPGPVHPDIRQHVDNARRAIIAADAAMNRDEVSVLREAVLREAYAHLRECAHAAYRAAGLLRQIRRKVPRK